MIIKITPASITSPSLITTITTIRIRIHVFDFMVCTIRRRIMRRYFPVV